MYARTFHATHPAMMATASGADLRDRYLVTDLFRAGEIVLTYAHDERFVIGSAVPQGRPLALPRPTEPPSAAGRSLLERRELGIVNVGAAGQVLVDGAAIDLGRHDALYVPMGTQDVAFTGEGARFFLLSVPAHMPCPLRRITLADVPHMERGSGDTANDRHIHQLILPGRCASAALCVGLTRLKPGSVWNTMPPHVHDRRSEVYLYFDLGEDDRVFHFMGQPDDLRAVVVANEQAVISPPWSVHMGAGTRAYSFIWAMAGENLDYEDMDVCAVSALA
ncbi:5-dehydro-4-deoxy-D-glucuronate isomerase [Sphingomonas sp. CLY1604]|uniref:5-dehydro-4-deoxy-D-glucuronate isomerase n=1 Tax=Sphingomonas sp. CLY1604 TaxID=3457786 RepID=UPI003FD6D95D